MPFPIPLPLPNLPTGDLLAGALPPITGGHAGPSTASGTFGPASFGGLSSPFVVGGAGSKGLSATSSGAATSEAIPTGLGWPLLIGAGLVLAVLVFLALTRR